MEKIFGVSPHIRLINRFGVLTASAMTTVLIIIISVGTTSLTLKITSAQDYSVALILSFFIPAILAPVFAYTTYHLLNKLNQQDRLLHTYAQEDALTGLYNRRYFTELAEKEIERAKRYALPISMIMIDIDQFKRINDENGHLVGDAVLRSIGKELRETLRTSDIAGRFGGDEFLILLPHINEEQAKEIGERVRSSLGEYARNGNGGNIRYEISLGISSLNHAGQNFDDLVQIADKNMYAAKHS